MDVPAATPMDDAYDDVVHAAEDARHRVEDAAHVAHDAAVHAKDHAGEAAVAAKGAAAQLFDLAVHVAAIVTLFVVAAWAVLESQVERRIPALSDAGGKAWAAVAPHLHTAWSYVMRGDRAVGGYLRHTLERVVDRSRALADKKKP
eukprot:CAMPEP_0174829484 /NCGR_PEP_ID=MMETSP1114-20130205/1952_1 /TAXON_ID=312471 /ORGANISM="Neobodo designis, Strain CCAP 1951/1" /LENGTH=145 /DNA_ID=CAMNT_0016063233 /DNA_START=73 /DNA_END=510 /DNA_ORIENTATION=+